MAGCIAGGVEASSSLGWVSWASFCLGPCFFSFDIFALAHRWLFDCFFPLFSSKEERKKRTSTPPPPPYHEQTLFRPKHAQRPAPLRGPAASCQRPFVPRGQPRPCACFCCLRTEDRCDTCSHTLHIRLISSHRYGCCCIMVQIQDAHQPVL